MTFKQSRNTFIDTLQWCSHESKSGICYRLKLCINCHCYDNSLCVWHCILQIIWGEKVFIYLLIVFWWIHYWLAPWDFSSDMANFLLIKRKTSLLFSCNSYGILVMFCSAYILGYYCSLTVGLHMSWYTWYPWLVSINF